MPVGLGADATRTRRGRCFPSDRFHSEHVVLESRPARYAPPLPGCGLRLPTRRSGPCLRWDMPGSSSKKHVFDVALSSSFQDSRPSVLDPAAILGSVSPQPRRPHPSMLPQAERPELEDQSDIASLYTLSSSRMEELIRVEDGEPRRTSCPRIRLERHSRA